MHQKFCGVGTIRAPVSEVAVNCWAYKVRSVKVVFEARIEHPIAHAINDGKIVH